MSQEKHLGTGEVARRIGQGVRSSDVSMLFYQGKLREDLCPLIAGRRCIPESYIPQIEMALKRQGKLRGQFAIA